MSSKLIVLIAALCALLLVPLMAGEARAQKRVALVIGNGAYQNVAQLPNPIKDATAIVDMFNEAGFDWVKLKQDLGNLRSDDEAPTGRGAQAYGQQAGAVRLRFPRWGGGFTRSGFRLHSRGRNSPS